MKVLFLTRDLPYPATNGYKKRNYYLLKELFGKGVDVVLFTGSSRLISEEQLTGIKKYCVDVKVVRESKPRYLKVVNAFLSLFSVFAYSLKMRVSKKVKKEIEKYLKNNKVDVIICDCIYQSLNVSLGFKGQKVLYEHNIESLIIKRYMQKERNVFKKAFAFIEWVKMERFQRLMWSKFDLCVACSDWDKKYMMSKSGVSKVVAVNNGVDTEFYLQGLYSEVENTLIYTGQIGWFPNEDAVLYFVDEILPLVKKKVPNVKFQVVGDNPSSRVRRLDTSDKAITVTGFVGDVRTYIDKASVYAVPLRIGSGTRIKILEAMSMKKAIVSTSIGCEGLGVAHNEHLIIQDEPEKFAEAVVLLLKNKGMRERLGENGRRLVEERYDWSKVFSELSNVFKVSEKGVREKVREARAV